MTANEKETIAKEISLLLADFLKQKTLFLSEAGRIATRCLTLLEKAPSPQEFKKLLNASQKNHSFFTHELSRRLK